MKIDPVHYYLQQDYWSISRPIFGEEQQLEVIGWNGQRTKSGNKIYVVKCKICEKDQELFPDGTFVSTRGNLEAGKIPCGCSKATKWSKDQWKILATRAANDLGLRYIDMVSPYRGCDTKIIIECNKHGRSEGKTLEWLVIQKSGCVKCAQELLAIRNTKPDSEMIASFFASGAFHPDTKFSRISRVSRQGSKIYWKVLCPECGEEGESTSCNLQLGQRPCECSRSRQKEAYINIILIEEKPIALKFGIANSTKSRFIQQSRNNPKVTIQNYKIYKFQSRLDCLKAEAMCKDSLVTGILSKEQLPDGWSETVCIENLESIIAIYEQNGGIEIGKISS